MVKDYIQVLLKAGWSQARIADESGIHQPCINRILKGRQIDVHYAQGKRLEGLAFNIAAAQKVGAGDTAKKTA